jgi:GTP-binding protein HflX
VLSDTVGFIRDLPHSLVVSFHATLEETAAADLLLHVVDSASEDRDQQVEAVNQVLREIGAGEVPQVVVWNKIDATRAEPRAERDEYGRIRRVFLSARTGLGLDLLRQALVEAARAHADNAAAADTPRPPAEFDPLQL